MMSDPPMSRKAALRLIEKLEKEPVLQTVDEIRLVIAALRFYATSRL